MPRLKDMNIYEAHRIKIVRGHTYNTLDVIIDPGADEMRIAIWPEDDEDESLHQFSVEDEAKEENDEDPGEDEKAGPPPGKQGPVPLPGTTDLVNDLFNDMVKMNRLIYGVPKSDGG